MLTGVPAEEATTTPLAVPSSTALAKRAIGLVVLLVILALTVSVLPGLGDVRARFGRAEPLWIFLTFACSLLSLALAAGPNLPAGPTFHVPADEAAYVHCVADRETHSNPKSTNKQAADPADWYFGPSLM